jgi:glycosyltransferase involved in cell wall biosynthesis/ribosomal protein S18 acetylase RimI-like enzyme
MSPDPLVKCRPMTLGDVRHCAELHTRAFPLFFLATLGEGFLRVLYRSFIGDPTAVAVVAQCVRTGEILGVAVGTTDPSGFFRRLALRNWPRFALAALPRVVLRPRAALRLARGLVYRGGSVAQRYDALLSSICVSPSSQGRGVGHPLLRAWESAACGRGASSACLATDRDENEGANRFYSRAGWQRVDEEQTLEGRWLNFYAKELPGAATDASPLMPRVLHVVGASSFGGASRVIASLVAGATGTYDVRVLTTEPRLAALVEAQGARCIGGIEIIRPLSPWRDVQAAVRLWRHLRAEDYAIVHTHTSKGGAIGRIAGRFAGVPVRVHTMHNLAVSPESRWWAKSANVAAEWLLGRVTTHLVTVSEGLLQTAIRYRLGARGRIQCIPNGIPDLPRPVQPGSSSSRKVVYHGRLAEGKGLPELLDAVTILESTLDECFELDIYGRGDLWDYLAAEISSRELTSVTLHGFVEDVHRVLSRADVCVQPSHREGLSIALLEAMRAGTQIVASNIAANEEVLGIPPVGRLFEVGSAQSLAESLRRALRAVSDGSAEEFSARARSRFEELYVESVMQAHYVEMYTRALRSGRRSAGASGSATGSESLTRR